MNIIWYNITFLFSEFSRLDLDCPVFRSPSPPSSCLRHRLCRLVHRGGEKKGCQGGNGWMKMKQDGGWVGWPWNLKVARLRKRSMVPPSASAENTGGGEDQAAGAVVLQENVRNTHTLFTKCKNICRKMKRSHGKWQQSLGRLWWMPSMVMRCLWSIVGLYGQHCRLCICWYFG